VCAFVLGHIIDSLAHLVLERGLADRFYSRPFSSQLGLRYPKSGFNWIANDAYIKNLFISVYLTCAFFLLHSVGFDGKTGLFIGFAYFICWVWVGMLGFAILLSAAGRASRGVLILALLIAIPSSWQLLQLAFILLPIDWATTSLPMNELPCCIGFHLNGQMFSWALVPLVAGGLAILVYAVLTFLIYYRQLALIPKEQPHKRVELIEIALQKIQSSFGNLVDRTGGREISLLMEASGNGGGPNISTFELEKQFLPGGDRHNELSPIPLLQTSQNYFDIQLPVRGAIFLTELSCLRAPGLPFLYVGLIFGLFVKYTATTLLLHRPLSPVLRELAILKIAKHTGMDFDSLDKASEQLSLLGSDVHAVAYFDTSESHFIARERIRLQFNNTMFARNLALSLMASGLLLGTLWFFLTKGAWVGFSISRMFFEKISFEYDTFPAEQTIGIFLYFLGSVLVLRFLLLYFDSGRTLWRAFALSSKAA
jgi:hypothetical protein